MPRIPGVDPESADGPVKATFDAQTTRWGAPLNPYPIYARRPSILRAVLGMWGGLDQSGLLDGRLKALLNRRVASLNLCEF